MGHSCVYYSQRKRAWVAEQWLTASLRQRFEDGGDFAAGGVVVGDFFMYLFPAMHDGGVVTTAKLGADLQPGGVGLLTHDVHGDLARPDDFAIPLLAAHEGRVDAVVAADTFQHLGHGQVSERLAIGVEVFERLHGEADSQRGLLQRGVGNDAIKRAFQFAHAFALWPRDIVDHRGGTLKRSDSVLERRIASRCSYSGGWISASRPHSKRERRRSCRLEMAFGGRSLVTTICLLALCSVLKV